MDGYNFNIRSGNDEDGSSEAVSERTPPEDIVGSAREACKTAEI